MPKLGLRIQKVGSSNLSGRADIVAVQSRWSSVSNW